jgi:tetratricopeptide (TPR) repeat protein
MKCRKVNRAYFFTFKLFHFYNPMKNNPKQMIISLALVALGFGLIFVLSNFLEKSRPPLPENYEDQDLALQGAKLKNYSLGFNGLMADWYWMQSLQYIGNKLIKSKDEEINLENLRPLNPRLLYPLLDNATTLDPNFMAAYSYGAVVLPAIDPQQAIKIAEKGIANNPMNWRLYQHLGYIYWRLKNYEKAAEVYGKGAQISDAPTFMKMMAAQMKSAGGSRQTARVMYEQMFREAEDSQTKEIAELRLMQLDSLEEREIIRAALQEFKAKQGRCVNNWIEIFPMLKSSKLKVDKANNLVDPSGIPYLLDKQNCEVNLDRQNSKIPPQ